LTNGSKIKLLIFTPTLQCGGSEKFVSLICDHIDTDRFSVCLVVLNNTRPFYRLKNPQVELVDLKAGRVRSSLLKIRKAVKAYQPDIIFSSANHLNLYFAVFRNWFPRQIKFLARESSIVSINSRRAVWPWFYNRLLNKYLRRFDLIVCQSVYMQQDLIRHYRVPENRTLVIHNAAEVRKQVPLPVTGKMDEPYKFVTVSRLSEEKGIERLIHAVGLLTLPFEYYIIGEGDERENLRRLISELQLQDKVFLTGQKEDAFAGMEDADLFLIGSYYEGFPNVLLEAGACGIPVVAFHAPGGIDEIITDGNNGLLVEDNDLIGFASAINKAIVSGFDRNKIIETTQKRFSVNAMMKKLEGLLLQL